jgi:CBS domain-containing protein
VRDAAEFAAPATFVEQELSRLGISAVPVADPGGYLVGVLSRTDLLRGPAECA